MSHKWHAMESKDVISTLKTGPKGLSAEEAKRRLEESGPNELEKARRKSPVKLFIEQFTSFLIIILLIATACMQPINKYVYMPLIIEQLNGH